MSATELQNIARRLSNSCWCRHWLDWQERRPNPMMGIQCLDATPYRCGEFRWNPIRVRDLVVHGFTEMIDPVYGVFYTIARTNEDGTPYVVQ